jgi:two-component system response regulator AtoC
MKRKFPDKERLRVLVVEDDEIMLMSLIDRLKIEEIDAVGVQTLADARWWLGSGGVDLVVCDICLPDGSGCDLFKEISRMQTGFPFILMTAFGSVTDAVSLVKLGAIDYLEKPFDMLSFISLVRWSLSNISDARLAVGSVAERYRLGSGLLGQDAAIRRIERVISRIRDLDSPILLIGEAGTGKKQIAAQIHHNSHRANGPFIKLSCSFLENDAEMDQAFSKAVADAEGGTLFLAEVADLPDRLQKKILDLLAQPQPNVRVIAAHRVEPHTRDDDNFAIRPDLLWRLDVVHINVPPLRDRPNDIVHLARMFLSHACRGRQPLSFSQESENWLRTQPLYGNGRELRRMIERSVTLVKGQQVDLEHLEDALDSPPPPQPLKTAIEKAERSAILSALAFCQGSISKTAETLGISRKNLWEKMNRLNISH